MDLSTSISSIDRDALAAIDHDDLVSLRALLVAELGTDYRRFQRTLKPIHLKVWRDIAGGYLGLIVVIALAASVQTIVAGSIAAVAGAVAIGYGIAYLQLFLHEAAHGNLAGDRKTNDRIADWLIAWQVGTRIADYRRTHSEHHRSLGEVADTEVSYRMAVSPRFLLEMTTGIHALRVFLARRKSGSRGSGPIKSDKAIGLHPAFKGGLVHLILVGTLLGAGAWPAALAWVAGVGSAYPFFATLRQILEHRPTHAEGQGGAVTRLFGDGPISSTFGGAGFNRHFLHHLEPQISYTRLRDFERYLSESIIAPSLDARRTSYLATFSQLLRDR